MRRFRLWCELSIGCAAVILMAASGVAYALPPLGLAEIDPSADGGALLSIQDDTAYLSTTAREPTGTVWIVGPDGSLERRQVSHPELGTRSVPTRVVTGPDEDLYVAAEFVSSPPNFAVIGSALFRLNQPETPIVTWDAAVVGLDGSLRGLGYGEGTTAELFMDGTIRPFDLPEDPWQGGPIFTSILDVSESGYAVGGAQQPGTAGIVGAMWSPAGEFSHLSIEASSVRDRADGRGVNIGFGVDPSLIYGDLLTVRLSGLEDGVPIHFYNGRVVASQSDFAVAHGLRGGAFAYYPGIVPGEQNIALPIEEIFPELATINFDGVSDLYAVDGRIYMTLYGEDGLYLFGARDPSVVPEPSSIMLAVGVVAIGILALRQGRASRGVRASLR